MKNPFSRICEIADRTESIYAKLDLDMPMDRMSLIMDLHYCDMATPLDLDGLLATDDGNFIHDVAGIMRHFNRNTRKLDNCFYPRFALGNQPRLVS